MIEKTKKLSILSNFFNQKIFFIKITLNLIVLLILSASLIYICHQNIKISENNKNLEAEINDRKQHSNAQKEEINNLVSKSRSLYEQVICDKDNCLFKNQVDKIYGYFTIKGYFEQVIDNPNRDLWSYRFYVEPVNEKLLLLFNNDNDGRDYLYLGSNYDNNQEIINKINKSNRLNPITITIKKFSDCGYSYDAIYNCRDKIEIVNP